MPLPDDIDDLTAWLRLSMEPGLKPATLRALLSAAGLPAQIYARDAPGLARLLPASLAAQLAQPPGPRLQAGIAAALSWAASPGPHHILTLADAAYPRSLLAIADPPPLLYVHGDPAALSRPTLAVVGARNATAGGLANARAFARHLAESGWCVASGLARGIDAAAHEGALSAGPQGAGTVAVLGTGIDRVYPRAHQALAQRIAGHGALVSELPPGALPLPHHFPRRNRLVAGLARGVLVVEAASRSGSLSTARLAADAGREVFAIPGSIHSPLSRGCHALIRQGARLVETALDIDDELGPRPGLPDRPDTRAGSPAAPGVAAGTATKLGEAGTAPEPGATARAGAPIAPDAAETRAAAGLRAASRAVFPAPSPQAGPARDLWLALAYDPVHPDELQRRTGLDGAALQAGLLELELAGLVARLDGGRYQRLTS